MKVPSLVEGCAGNLQSASEESTASTKKPSHNPAPEEGRLEEASEDSASRTKNVHSVQSESQMKISFANGASVETAVSAKPPCSFGGNEEFSVSEPEGDLLLEKSTNKEGSSDVFATESAESCTVVHTAANSQTEDMKVGSEDTSQCSSVLPVNPTEKPQTTTWKHDDVEVANPEATDATTSACSTEILDTSEDAVREEHEQISDILCTLDESPTVNVEQTSLTAQNQEASSATAGTVRPFCVRQIA